MTVIFSVYSSSIEKSLGWLMMVSLIVIDTKRSKTLIAVNIFLCFTTRLTVLSDSVEPNSMVAEVV